MLNSIQKVFVVITFCLFSAISQAQHQAKIVYPSDGDIFHSFDKSWDGRQHVLSVQASAPAGAMVFINGQKATFSNGVYTARITLTNRQNTITLRVDDQPQHVIKVYTMKNLAGKYRLSVDDNIWWLRDLATKAYTSVFDHPYLAVFKMLNEKYGTKVHFNLFYENDPSYNEAPFNLSQMPDRYKAEWQANASWIHFSFHARREFPDAPYANADYQTVAEDCRTVLLEIERFAGKEVMGNATTVHWGAANRYGVQALQDAGYRVLVGYFNIDKALPGVAYYLDDDQIRHIRKRFVWKDNEADICFIRSSIVIDTEPLMNIPAYLDEHAKGAPLVELLVHEQYFYPHYKAYQPDYAERLEAAVRWAHEQGYKPSLIGEAIQ